MISLIKVKKIFIISIFFIITFAFSTYAKTCFVGDSRTVGMKESVEDHNSLWCCKVGMGYKYLSNTCDKFIKEHINEIDKVVCLFGVNDIANYKKYNDYLIELKNKYNFEVYFVSVNPVINDKSKYVKIKDIFAFNYYMRNHLGPNIKYIDTYNNIDFKYTDGIHYKTETYKEIYNYIKAEIDKE